MIMANTSLVCFVQYIQLTKREGKNYMSQGLVPAEVEVVLLVLAELAFCQKVFCPYDGVPPQYHHRHYRHHYPCLQIASYHNRGNHM